MSESAPAALVLQRRQPDQPPGAGPFLRLVLSAEERSRLRGHRLSRCGRDLVLQLERGEPLRPGEWLLGGAGDPPVLVEAAPEALLQVSAAEPLPLDFNSLMTTSMNLSVARLAWRLLCGPHQIPALIRFGRQTQRAAGGLAEVLTAVLLAT